MKLKFNNKDDSTKSAVIGYVSDNRVHAGLDKLNDLSNIVAWYHAAHDGDDIDTFLDDVLLSISDSGELVVDGCDE